MEDTHMSAAQVLAAAHAAGLRVSVNGGDLELEAVTPPPEPLLLELKRSKVELLQLLSSQAADRKGKRQIVDWLDAHPEQAPCWCTRTTEVSIICMAVSCAADRATMIRSQTPACGQRTKRL
jgi:hypothetical protein